MCFTAWSIEQGVERKFERIFSLGASFKVLLLHCVTELMNVRELNFLKNNCNLPHLWFICNFIDMVKLLFYKF